MVIARPMSNVPEGTAFDITNGYLSIWIHTAISFGTRGAYAVFSEC